MITARSQETGVSFVPRLPSRIPSLDGLRAVSIMLVLIGHSAVCSNAPAFLTHFDHAGNFGVRCFFIISGFLITTLLLKERETTGRISMKGFYIRRALRIFPPSLAYIGIIATCSALGWLTLKPGDLIHALTYTMNYHLHRAWWLDHLWSLSVEEQFYLLWPGLLYWVGNRRGMKTAWGVVFVVPVIRAVMWFLFHANDSAMTKHFEANADALATGCLLSMNFNQLGMIRFYQRFQSSSFYWICALGLVLGGHGLFAINPVSFYIIGQTIANLGIALCIDWSIRNPGKGVGLFLNWGPVVYIGVLSYSLYLWQNVFLNADWDAWPARLPINILLAFGMALASYYLVERPFLRLKTLTQHKRRTRSIVADSAE
jgi:peptidoglycan/LPS O-acetylase OafA/YrhL